MLCLLNNRIKDAGYLGPLPKFVSGLRSHIWTDGVASSVPIGANRSPFDFNATWVTAISVVHLLTSMLPGLQLSLFLWVTEVSCHMGLPLLKNDDTGGHRRRKCGRVCVVECCFVVGLAGECYFALKSLFPAHQSQTKYFGQRFHQICLWPHQLQKRIDKNRSPFAAWKTWTFDGR